MTDPQKAGAGGPPARPVPPGDTWLAGAPPLPLALQMLRREVPVPQQAAAAVQRVRGAFSDIEEDALEADGLPFDVTPFRNALGTQLQLALALEHTAQAAGKVDTNALNQLLAQVDVVLEGLRLLDEGQLQPVVVERVHLTRDALVRDAVSLSGVNSPNPAEPARFSGARKAGEGVGKLVLMSAEDVAADTARSKRQRLLVAAVVMVLLAGAGLHVWNARTTPPLPLPTVPGAPAGITVREAPGGRLTVQTLDGAAPGPEVQQWMQGYVARGYELRPLGQSLFVLQPAPTQPPAREVSP